MSFVQQIVPYNYIIPWKETNDRNSIVDLMDELDLVDIYRKLHPNTKAFTYELKSLKLRSRIDYFLVSNTIAVNATRAEIRPSIAPDHKAISCLLKPKGNLREARDLTRPQLSLCSKVEEQRMMEREKGKRRLRNPVFKMADQLMAEDSEIQAVSSGIFSGEIYVVLIFIIPFTLVEHFFRKRCLCSIIIGRNTQRIVLMINTLKKSSGKRGDYSESSTARKLCNT